MHDYYSEQALKFTPPSNMNTGYQPFHQQAASPVGYYDMQS